MKIFAIRSLVNWIGITGLLAIAIPVQADLKLGVHPFKPPSKLIESFSPLANYLSEKLGEPVTLQIAKDYQEHINATWQGKIDIAYLGPVSYVELHDSYGPTPLLARQAINGNPVFHGKIFVRKESGIRSLTDLKGKSFAFGEPHSTMSHLVPRHMLWQAGVGTENLTSHKFVGDHVNVALSVLSGEFDAGGVKEDIYFNYERRGLRAIATSPPLSDHLFVASRKMPAAMIRKLQGILLQLHNDPQGMAALQSLTKGITALVPVQDSDYDSLRTVLRKMKEIGVEY